MDRVARCDLRPAQSRCTCRPQRGPNRQRSRSRSRLGSSERPLSHRAECTTCAHRTSTGQQRVREPTRPRVWTSSKEHERGAAVVLLQSWIVRARSIPSGSVCGVGPPRLMPRQGTEPRCRSPSTVGEERAAREGDEPSLAETRLDSKPAVCTAHPPRLRAFARYGIDTGCHPRGRTDEPRGCRPTGLFPRETACSPTRPCVPKADALP